MKLKKNNKILYFKLQVICNYDINNGQAKFLLYIFSICHLKPKQLKSLME